MVVLLNWWVLEKKHVDVALFLYCVVFGMFIFVIKHNLFARSHRQPSAAILALCIAQSYTYLLSFNSFCDDEVP